jgi:hypothetical protein
MLTACGISLGEEFVLEIGSSAVITGEDMEISFEQVLEESRCPRDVTCVWEGRVVMVIEIRRNSTSHRMELIQPGLTDQAITAYYEDYALRFSVEPYPEEGSDIAADDYRLRMTVSKK